MKVDKWEVLASTKRPFPDKWHGISDPDTRYRQRYVDMWVTEEAKKAFVLRSNLISMTRKMVRKQGFHGS